MDSWKEKGVYEEVDYDTRDVNATIVGIRDLWTKKSDNNGDWSRNKLRTIAQGFNCEEGKDFGKMPPSSPPAPDCSRRVLLGAQHWESTERREASLAGSASRGFSSDSSRCR